MLTVIFFRERFKSPANGLVEEAEEAKEENENHLNNNKNVEKVETSQQEVVLTPALLISPDSHLDHHQRRYHDLSSVSSVVSCESRQDSIVELYCDDELRVGVEFENIHLNLTHHDDLGLVDDILISDDDEDVFLPHSLPSMLNESFKEQMLSWDQMMSDTSGVPCVQVSPLSTSDNQTLNTYQM